MHEEFKIFRVKRVLLTEYVEKRLIEFKQCGANGPRASTGGRGAQKHKQLLFHKVKAESIRKLSNFNFQWTKTL